VAGLVVFADTASAQQNNHQKTLPQFEVMSARELGPTLQTSPRPEPTFYPLDSVVIPSSNLQQLKLGRSLYYKHRDCDVLVNPRSNACLGTSVGKEPSNLFEKIVQKSAGYAPILFGGKDVDVGSIVEREATDFLISSGVNYANKEIQKIPFLAQTTIGISQSTASGGGAFYIDSLMKLKTLGKDAQGDPQGLIIGQARLTTDWDFSESTINTGLGTRYRIGNDAMVGLNGFLDYRINDYASYRRWGVGVEGFYKDFELRNNWYISGTDTKEINIAGTDYYERVVPGWDVELGYRLPSYPELAFFVKGFGWDYVSRENHLGVGGYVNWQATPNVNLEAGVSNEINNDVFVNFRFRYTFQKVIFAKKDYKKINLTRMTEPVRRRYEVLLERWLNPSGSGSGFVSRVAGS